MTKSIYHFYEFMFKAHYIMINKKNFIFLIKNIAIIELTKFTSLQR